MRTVGLILPPEEPAYICPHCGKNYKSEAALTKHLQDKHPDLTEGQRCRRLTTVCCI